MALPEELQTDGPASPHRGPKELVRRSLITGTAIILPLAVTLFILGFVLNFISTQLDPFTTWIQNSQFVARSTRELLIKGVTVATFLFVVFVLGFVAEFSPGSTHLGRHFHDLMESVPGVGAVYTSFNEMSEILLDSDTDSFQDVKLVEYPVEGSYTVAFKTAESPALIEAEADHDDMVTLFMPMAPNPVMGGFVIHVSREKVVDVDMTVEQGIRSIVTSGVAIGDDGSRGNGLTTSEMRELGQLERVDQPASADGDASDTDAPEDRGDEQVTTADRVEEYAADVSPEHSDTAQKLADRAHAERASEADHDTPVQSATETPADPADSDDAE